MDLLRSVLARQPLDKLKKLTNSSKFYTFRWQLIIPEKEVIVGLTHFQMFQLYGELTDEVPVFIDRRVILMRAIFMRDGRVNTYYDEELSSKTDYRMGFKFSPIPLDNEKFFSKLTDYAISIRNLALLGYLIDLGFPITVESLVVAAEAEDLAILQFLANLIPIRSTDVPKALARKGNLELLTWAHFQRFIFDYWVAEAAAEAGKLEVLQWLVSRGYEVNNLAFAAAAKFGHLEILKWGKANNYRMVNYYHGAAKNGQLNVLEFVIDNEQELTAVTFATMARAGSLQLVKKLKSKGCRWDAKTFAEAAKSGNLELLIWLKENDCPYDTDATTSAANSGHLHLLKWMRQQKFPFGDNFVRSAVWSGNLEMIVWLKSERFTFDNEVCEIAARCRQFHIFFYLIYEGCGISADTLKLVVQSGNLQELIKVTQLPGIWWSWHDCFSVMIHNRYIHMIIWLYDYGDNFVKKEIKYQIKYSVDPVSRYWLTTLDD